VSEALALVAGIGVFLTVAGSPRIGLASRLEIYLGPQRRPIVAEESPSAPQAAGLSWSPAQLVLRRGGAAAAGAVVGLLLAQGDLFVSGPSRSAPALGALGAATGVLILNMSLSTRRQHRARRLRHELPVVAEAIALHVMAGESVATATARFVSAAEGVAAEELAVVLADVERGSGIPEALYRAGSRTVEPEAARLYSALGHAHVSGGRLGATLTELAVDYRASLARDLASEGGRRALATYGPVLGLMVPVTLLFLLYPTIDGLRRLAP
jgi:tight adherence protein C